MSVQITLEDAPDEATQHAVYEGLTRFNEARVGPCPTLPIWVVARDGNGVVIGGVQGVVSWTWLYLNMLWVDDSARGAGLGSSLLKRAEEAAVNRGCTDVFLYTFSFQAPEFYRRHGYEVFGDLECFPGDNHQFWMRKKLSNAS
ncbi:GNAT family N-acetyltransferase [Hansschlegelia sp. KR7-227]|uniref:GNAT family N-acetyltransferase n=1 Tax=Hansschlegelia sp. KR7-227 TaxID=3400914 RepID=UPI003C107229